MPGAIEPPVHSGSVGSPNAVAETPTGKVSSSSAGAMSATATRTSPAKASDAVLLSYGRRSNAVVALPPTGHVTERSSTP